MNVRRSLLLCLLPIVTACSRPEAPPPKTEPVVRTLIVDGATTGTGRQYSGEVRARYEVPLAFRVGGKILARPVTAGDRVRAGQLLASLDPADLQLQAAQAAAQLGLARAEAQRYRELARRNFVSSAALDARETALTAAQAQAGLSANQAAYARLLADGPGVVAAVLAEPGQVVSAGQSVIRLALDGDREVAIALPESALAGLAPGAAAEVHLWASGRRLAGHVREIAAAADPATRTYAARITVPGAVSDLILGMSATVTFPHGAVSGSLIPISALFQQGERSAVFLVGADRTLELRPVTVGAYTDQGALVTDGLAAGERLVAAGVHKLQPGLKVRVAP